MTLTPHAGLNEKKIIKIRVLLDVTTGTFLIPYVAHMAFVSQGLC